MRRDRNFIINSIKMDLYRVVTAAGDITKEMPTKSIQEFINHATADFEKLELNEKESNLKNELLLLTTSINSCQNDPHKRLKWAEQILTIRCRL